VAVKRKGKIKIVTKTVSKFVVEDFGWKDPDAAEKAGMATQDYVISGMDRSVPGHALPRAARARRRRPDARHHQRLSRQLPADHREPAGGLSSDRSYHGGSFHGGYGHGHAADIVSVKGETRADRLVSSNVLWRWIDAHEKELGIGRPYRDQRSTSCRGRSTAGSISPTAASRRVRPVRRRLADRARHGDKNHQAEKKKKTKLSRKPGATGEWPCTARVPPSKRNGSPAAHDQSRLEATCLTRHGHLTGRARFQARTPGFLDRSPHRGNATLPP